MELRLVTETSPREAEYLFRRVEIYNCYPGKVRYDPWDDFPEVLNLSVHKDLKKQADALVMEFYNLGPNPDKEIAKPIIDKLFSICKKYFFLPSL